MENGEINTRGKGNKNLTGFLAGAFCVGFLGLGMAGVSVYKANEHAKKETHAFMSILDKDKSGKLDAKEIKSFYDATGLNPYTTPFDSLTQDQVSSFVAKYSKKK
jgi:hypothetical protein